MSEKQSYRDSDDMPTERAVLEREWKAMRLALSMPRAAVQAAQPGSVPAKNNDVDRLLRQVFLLCEAVEDLPEIDPKNEHERGFDRGRRFQAKQIRRAIGDWFQWTFCGSSFMGEPVISAAPTEAKPAQDAVDAARWREASTSRNFGITNWTQFGQSTVYDAAANQLIDAAISAKKGG